MNTKFKNGLCLILILICLSFVLFKLALRVNQVRVLKKEIYEIEQKQDINTTRIDNLQLRFKLSFLNEEEKLATDLTVKNEEGKLLKLSELVKEGKKLVLRISNTHCSACLHNLSPFVAEFIKSVGENNVIYLSDYENTRILRLLKSNYKINNEVYSIKQLNLPIEASNIPFLFVLDEQMKVQLLFAPIKEMSKLTEDYFNAIKYRFWR